MLPWFRKRIIKAAAPFSLENQVELCYENDSPYRLEGKYFFGQFAGAPGVEEAKGLAMREQPDLAAEALYEHFRDRLKPLFFLHNSEQKILQQKLQLEPQAAKLLVQASQEALRRLFPLPPGQKTTFPKCIDWLTNFQGDSWPPLSSRQWRQRWEADPSSALPSLEWTWALNEHYHFLALGRTTWLTGNENFVSEALVQATEWLASNPLWRGVNWLNFERVATRACNWMGMLTLALSTSLLTPELFVKVLEGILLHAAALSWHLRNDASLSLGAASALYMLANNLPELKLAKRWRALALEKWPELIKREFGAGSFHLSDSLSGHCRASEWLLLPLVQHIHNRTTPPHFLEEAAHNTLEALQNVCGPDHLWSEFGEATEHGWLGREQSLGEYITNVLALGALTLKEGRFKYQIERMPSELWWWMGPKAQELFADLPAEIPTSTCAYLVSNGLGVARDTWAEGASQVSIKATAPESRQRAFYRAPGAPDPAASNSNPHGDFLSIALNIQGEPFFIEPGPAPATYAGAPYLQSFLAHSTLLIGEECQPFQLAYWEEFSASERQTITSEGLTCLNHAPRSLCSPLYLQSAPTETFFKAGRQALLNGGQVLGLTRELLFRPQEQRLFIRDSVAGPEGLKIHLENSLLFAPHLKLIMRGDMGCLARSRQISARVMPIFPKGSRHVQGRGLMGSAPTGWYYREGKMHATNQIRYYCLLELPLRTYFVIDWTRKEPPRFKGALLDELFAAFAP